MAGLPVIVCAHTSLPQHHRFCGVACSASPPLLAAFVLNLATDRPNLIGSRVPLTVLLSLEAAVVITVFPVAAVERRFAPVVDSMAKRFGHGGSPVAASMGFSAKRREEAVTAFGRFDLELIDDFDDARHMPTAFEAVTFCIR